MRVTIININGNGAFSAVANLKSLKYIFSNDTLLGVTCSALYGKRPTDK